MTRIVHSLNLILHLDLIRRLKGDFVHLVTGDATKPQRTDSEPVIIGVYPHIPL